MTPALRLTAFLVIGLILGATSIAARERFQPAARVFVYTVEAKDGVKTEEEQGRLDSVRDMRDALARNSKIVLVSDASAAQVLVEGPNDGAHTADLDQFTFRKARILAKSEPSCW